MSLRLECVHMTAGVELYSLDIYSMHNIYIVDVYEVAFVHL